MNNYSSGVYTFPIILQESQNTHLHKYIYIKEERERRLFLFQSLSLFLSVYVSDNSTVKIDSILYPYLHACLPSFYIRSTKTKRKKEKETAAYSSLFPLRTISLKLLQVQVQEQLLQSSLGLLAHHITGPGPRMPPT